MKKAGLCNSILMYSTLCMGWSQSVFTGSLEFTVVHGGDRIQQSIWNLWDIYELNKSNYFVCLICTRIHSFNHLHQVWCRGQKQPYNHKFVKLKLQITFKLKMQCTHSKNKLILLILLICQKSALCIKPKDKLMCGASPSWGILLLKSQLPPLSRPMYTPIYTALGSSLLFLLERKGTRQPWFKKKKNPQTKFLLSETHRSVVVEWRVPRPTRSKERVCKNKEIQTIVALHS